MPKGSALKKEMKCSEELRDLIGEKKISRGDLMKKIWKYIDKHNLKGKEDGRIVECDEKLTAVFKKIIKHKRKFKQRGKTIRVPAGHIFMTEIAGGLTKHLS